MPKRRSPRARKGVLAALSLCLLIAFTAPAQAIAPALLLVEFGKSILAEIAAEVGGEVEKSVNSWVMSMLGLEEEVPKEDPRIQATIDKLNRMDGKLDEIRAAVSQGFMGQKCDLEKGLLKTHVSQVMTQFGILRAYSDPEHRRDWEHRVQWAREVTRSDTGLYPVLQNIHETLLGLNDPDQSRGGLLASCGRVYHDNWTRHGKLADERAYYEPLMSVEAFYYNVQTAGIQVLTNAFHLLATDAAKKAGKTIRADHIAQDVCGGFLKKRQLNPAESHCMDARQVTQVVRDNIHAQMDLVGAGYSYALVDTLELRERVELHVLIRLLSLGSTPPAELENPELERQVANISSLDPARIGNAAQLWVRDPHQYPSGQGTGTAAAASRLVNRRYAGLDGWRAANSYDWNRALDTADWNRDGGDVRAALANQLGLNRFGAPNSPGGPPSAVWMAEDSTGFGRFPDQNQAWCLLIPYGSRHDAKQGWGRPICDSGGVLNSLLDESSQSTYPSTTVKWLMGRPPSGERFRYGPSLLVNAGEWDHWPWLLGWRKHYIQRWDALIPEDGEYFLPDWVKKGLVDIDNQDKRLEISAEQRAPQIMVPVLDLSPDTMKSRCTSGRSDFNLNGVVRMCGEDMDLWLALQVPPIQGDGLSSGDD